jgi:AcrR family transcriptional regulator
MKGGIETSARILAAAKKLMWKHGIRRVTVDEICREAGVSKMTFYKYFDNKIALARILIQKSSDDGWARADEIMDGPGLFHEKAGMLIQLKIDQYEAWSGEIAREILDNSVPGLTEFVADLRRDNLARTITMFRRSQDKGEIRRDIRPEFILDVFNRLTDAARDRQLAAHYPSLQALVAEIMEFLYFGIMPRERGGTGRRQP